jgi:hypothetical protein
MFANGHDHAYLEDSIEGGTSGTASTAAKTIG